MLRYNMTKVKDFGTACYAKDKEGNDRINPVTQALVLLMTVIYIDKITEENVSEFAWRVRLSHSLVENSKGILQDDDGIFRDPTLEEIRMHVGMTVNVMPLTLAKYMSSLRSAWKCTLQ